MKIDPKDQPTSIEKEQTLRGIETGWDFLFEVPPVVTNMWGPREWIDYIGSAWFRKNSAQETTT